MPKKPIDYSKSIIYKLVSKNPDIMDIYVGSTTNFTKRKNAHKSVCNNPYNKAHNSKVYKFIRDNGGFDNWSIITIEQYNCNNKRELETRERYHFDDLKATLNNNTPTQTKKEYYIENKEQILEEKKEYYIENKEQIQEYNKEYYIEKK